LRYGSGSIGPAEELPELIWRFREMCDRAGGRHHEVDATIDAGTSMQFVLEKIARVMSEQIVSV